MKSYQLYLHHTNNILAKKPPYLELGEGEEEEVGEGGAEVSPIDVCKSSEK
jgi:hypothetical protein